MNGPGCVGAFLLVLCTLINVWTCVCLEATHSLSSESSEHFPRGFLAFAGLHDYSFPNLRWCIAQSSDLSPTACIVKVVRWNDI